MKRLVQEARRRRIGWVILIYLSAAIIAARFATTMLPANGAPDWLIQSVVAAAISGLIPLLFFAWRYRLGRTGLSREQALERDIDARVLPGRQLRFVAAFALGIAVTVVSLLQLPTETAMASLQSLPVTRSIAVLPFVTSSGDSRQQSAAEGLSTAIANRLAQLPGWHVPAQASAARFVAQSIDRATLAKQLAVSNLLSGSVERSGNQMRVTATLTDLRSGKNLWSRDFERELNAAFVVETEISSAVADALRTPGSSRAAVVGAGASHSLAALDEYWEGLHQLALKTRASSDAAMLHFNKAVSLDPQFAEAHAGIARAHLNLMAWYSATDRQTSVAKASAAVDRALALDERLVEAHEAFGELRLLGGPPAFGIGFYAQAQRAFAKALAINPNRASVYALIGTSSRMFGRFDEGIAAWKKAIALDPLSPEMHTDYGRTLDYAGRYTEAEAAFSEARRLDPDYADSYYAAANHFGGPAGRLDESARYADRANQLDPASPKYAAMLIAALADLELFDLAAAVEARSRSIGERDTFWLSKVVQLQARRGDFTAAMTATEQHDAIGKVSAMPQHVQLRLWSSGLQPVVLARIYARARSDFPSLFAANPRVDSPYAGEILASLIWLADLQHDTATRDRLLAFVRPYLPKQDDPAAAQSGMQPGDVMQFLALAGEKERALRTLEANVAPPNTLVGSGWWMLVDKHMSPLCQALCGDVRYEKIVSRIRAEVARQQAAYLAQPGLAVR